MTSAPPFENPNKDHGPTWYDVSQAVTAVEQEFACRVTLTLIPPMACGPSQTWSPWSVQAQVHRSGELLSDGPLRCQQWGRGGNWRTAPMACYHAVLALHTALSQVQAQAEQLAAF